MKIGLPQLIKTYLHVVMTDFKNRFHIAVAANGKHFEGIVN